MINRYIPLYIISFILALAVTAIVERRLIPLLSGRAAQPIYEDGPSWHSVKSGTPTMGGLAFLLAIATSSTVAIVITLGIGEGRVALSIITVIIYSILNAGVGIIDDTAKLKKKVNKGLSAKQKLLLQTLIAIGFLFARAYIFGDGTSVELPFGTLELGLFYYPLSLVLLLGIVNCANLTDGIDGLATGVSFTVCAVLFLLSAHVLPDTAIISASIMGICLGFMFFNIYPARIFMGDTGSLFLGAAAVSCAFSFKNPFLIAIIGIVYVIEGVSVILQVVFFKKTGKRLFKMAPLHHHFEKSGMSETKICLIAMIVTLLSSIPALILFTA